MVVVVRTRKETYAFNPANAGGRFHDHESPKYWENVADLLIADNDNGSKYEIIDETAGTVVDVRLHHIPDHTVQIDGGEHRNVQSYWIAQGSRNGKTEREVTGPEPHGTVRALLHKMFV
jgi:hypothetical protein